GARLILGQALHGALLVIGSVARATPGARRGRCYTLRAMAAGTGLGTEKPWNVAAFADGRGAPSVFHVPEDVFAAYAAERLPRAGAEPKLADLSLACACARGDARALAVFDATVLREVPRYVAHVDASPAFADDVCQRLRERLFVANPPKI